MDLALLVLPDFIIKTMFKVRNANGWLKSGATNRGLDYGSTAEFLK